MYILNIGTKLILGFPFLMIFKLALVPRLPYRVPIEAMEVRPWSGISMRTQALCPACRPHQRCRFRCMACMFMVTKRESAYLLSTVIARCFRASRVFSLVNDIIVKRMLMVKHTTKPVSPSTTGFWSSLPNQYLGSISLFRVLKVSISGATIRLYVFNFDIWLSQSLLFKLLPPQVRIPVLVFRTRCN